MAQHRWYEQNDNQSRQQPNRANDEIGWQRQINCADRQKREHGLPAWFRFVDVLRRLGHAWFISNSSNRG